MAKILGSLMLIALLAFSFAWASSNGTSDMAVGPVAITDGDGITPVPEIDMTWAVGTNQPTARYGAVSGWYNGEVYFTHGRISNAVPYNTALCEKFDPTPLPGVWTTLTPAPTARRMVGAGKVQTGSYIHSVGGRFDATTTVGTYERYDMATDTWITLAPCTPRWAHGAAALVNGASYNVYVFGGSDATVNTSVQRYDPATNAWSAVAPLPVGRGWCAGAALNGLVYCIGGSGSGANTMYEYNPATNAWTAKAPLPANRFYHWATADDASGKIYVFGGATVTAPTADVLVWDQATNTWSTETAMPGARNWPCVGGDNTQTFFVMGGFDGSAIYYNQSWIGEEGAATPSVTLDLTPTGSTVIPAGGGPLPYSLTLTNNESSALPFQYWCTYSQGAIVVAAFGPISRTSPAGPGYIIIRSLTQFVPGSLGAGAWVYNGYIGVYPASVWASDSFQFTKFQDESEIWINDPDPGELLPIGQNYTIRWNYYHLSGGHVKIEFKNNYPNGDWVEITIPTDRPLLDAQRFIWLVAGQPSDSCRLRITHIESGTSAEMTGNFRIANPVDVANNPCLLGHYPNPFNPTTTISFVLPEPAKVMLSVYDVGGRQVVELVNGWREAGSHEVTFDGSNLASGIYVYRLTAGGFNASGKMVLMK